MNQEIFCVSRLALTFPFERLCRNTVHGSSASPRTVLLDCKFRDLTFRAERVEELRANCDTVSDGGRQGWGCNRYKTAGRFHLLSPTPEGSK
jgi:hypothetical protein